MFEFIYDRSYQRNKKMLKALEISYSVEQHRKYNQEIKRKNLQPMSIPGFIKKSGLDLPVKKEKLAEYIVHQNQCEVLSGGYIDKPSSDMKRCEENTLAEAQKVTEQKAPLLRQYVQALSFAVGTELKEEFQQNLQEVLVSEETITDDHQDVRTHYAFACIQKWIISSQSKSTPVFTS